MKESKERKVFPAEFADDEERVVRTNYKFPLKEDVEQKYFPLISQIYADSNSFYNFKNGKQQTENRKRKSFF